jgi:hypothetical protein
MLVLQGLRWLREGRQVIVMEHATYPPRTFAAMIVHQLRATMKATSNEEPAVTLYCCDIFYGTDADVTMAVKDLTKFAEASLGQLYILMDETAFGSRLEKLRGTLGTFLVLAGVDFFFCPIEKSYKS